jgi:Dyp-type peroxidase family
MAVHIPLADIQGNILSGYGKLGFPKGRFMTLHVDDPASGRKFVNALLPEITTALRWPSERSTKSTGANPVPRPDVVVNIAFSWYGLVALGIPTRTLRGMPDEFIDGMIARAPMLGDDFTGPDWMNSWDPVWTAVKKGVLLSNPDTVHILITLNARMNPDGTAVAALATKTQAIEALCQSIPGVRILPGHGPARQQPPAQYQELSAILYRKQDGTFGPLPKEHFGYTDALGDPVFEGDGSDKAQVDGNGAVDGAGNWRPLATGEFLLGYPDEAQEIAGAAMPLDFSRNGTFMAYRKLHQNVDRFKTFMTEAGTRFGAVFGIANPADALETLKAKIAGRWSDGVPLALAPTADDWRAFNVKCPDVSPETDPDGYKARLAAIIHFTYANDKQGLHCPMTSHMRRVNTRDGLAPRGTEGSVLNNRRRILRRGLPYGNAEGAPDDSREHGIIMLVVCANLFRQFEFVQQQWINYGLDANAGNDTDPLVGNHSPGIKGPKAKFVIPSDPDTGRPPFILEGIPQFVETRGGEYFFVPSMTALHMIGMGVVDPT